MEDVLWIEVLLLLLIICFLMIYTVIDVAYFARMTVAVLWARYFKRNECIMEKIYFKSWCFLNDIDTLLYHMNNARYLRELDFARADFYERTGLYRSVCKAGGGIVQAATTIRYRRFIKPCNIFTITSKVVYWDEKTVFMEHEFVSQDGFINAVVICRQRVINISATDVMEKLIKSTCGNDCQKCNINKALPMPPEIRAWIESNEISSQKLRADLDAGNKQDNSAVDYNTHDHSGNNNHGQTIPSNGLTIVVEKKTPVNCNVPVESQQTSL